MGSYRLTSHAFALMDILNKSEAKRWSAVPEVRLAPGVPQELADAGLVKRVGKRVLLTDAGRRELERGYPGYYGREIECGP